MYSWCFDDGWYNISVVVPSPMTTKHKAWCEKNIGYIRSITDPDTFDIVVFFRNEQEATMFKLAFGGRYRCDPRMLHSTGIKSAS